MFAYRFLLDIPENYWAFSKNLESGTSQCLALPLMLQNKLSVEGNHEASSQTKTLAEQNNF